MFIIYCMQYDLHYLLYSLYTYHTVFQRVSFYATNFQPLPLIFNPFNPSQSPESSICILAYLYVIHTDVANPAW